MYHVTQLRAKSRAATHVKDGIYYRITDLSEKTVQGNLPTESLTDDISGYEEVVFSPYQPTLLETLDEAFEAQVPADVKPLFAAVYAQVRVLIQAGKIELAIALIEATEVPEDLESIKEAILGMIPH
ncbi:MAG: hypothetical protein QM680_14535 [Luteolibacter sp.]